MATSTAAIVAGSSATPISPCSASRTPLLTTIPPAPTTTNRRTRGNIRRSARRWRSLRATKPGGSAAAGAGWYHGRSLAGGMTGLSVAGGGCAVRPYGRQVPRTRTVARPMDSGAGPVSTLPTRLRARFPPRRRLGPSARPPPPDRGPLPPRSTFVVSHCRAPCSAATPGTFEEVEAQQQVRMLRLEDQGWRCASAPGFPEPFLLGGGRSDEDPNPHR